LIAWQPVRNRTWSRRSFDNGYDIGAVDVIPEYAGLGAEYSGAPDRVQVGRAEELPYADGTQSIVILDQVREHVDSPEQMLSEMFVYSSLEA
jgi:hypothetical protein